jgi:hypothetical protein
VITAIEIRRNEMPGIKFFDDRIEKEKMKKNQKSEIENTEKIFY